MSGFKGGGGEGSEMTPKNRTLEGKKLDIWSWGGGGEGVKNDPKKSDIIYERSQRLSLHLNIAFTSPPVELVH
jgi:hypothetical protein